MKFLDGKNTYMGVLALGILMFGQSMRWWIIPDQVYIGLLTYTGVSVRRGIKKAEPVG